MNRFITVLGITIALSFFLYPFVISRALAEDVTLTTYYPSPYGSYNELTVSSRMAIGDLNDDGKVDSGDLPMGIDENGNQFPLPGALSLHFLGVGTTTPWRAGPFRRDEWTRVVINGCISLEDPRVTNGYGPAIKWKGGPNMTMVYQAGVYPDGTMYFFPGEVHPEITGPGRYAGEALSMSQARNVGIKRLPDATYSLAVGGDAFATSWCTPSDIRMKTNIRSIDGALNKIKNINGVTFNWRDMGLTEKGLPSGRQIGIIAQEVEREFPEIVHADEKGYKSLDYNKFNAVLLEAIKELESENNALRTKAVEMDKRIKALESRLDIQ